MPIEIKKVNDGIGVIITGHWFMTDREYVETLRKHLTQDQEQFKKYRYSMADFTAITGTDVSTDSIKLISKLCINASRVNPAVLVATVVVGDLYYGLARMSDALRFDASWEEMIFDNREKAENWLREGVKRKYGIDDIKFK